jgi:6-phosphogluconolactonase (cycloisomerase 2 family)
LARSARIIPLILGEVMSMKVRALLSVGVVLSAMWLSSCGHYVCKTTFGSATCTPSGSGFSGGGGSNGAASAYAFAVNGNGSIDGYTLSATASTLTATPNYTAATTPANAGGVGMVVAQGKYLYTVYADLHEIYGWTIDSSGGLTPIGGFPIPVSLTIPTLLAFNQYAVITNPAGTLLFVSDAGINQIIVYQINTSGALTQAPGSPFPAGSIEPQNMGMDGQGRYLYVSSEGSSLDHAGTVVGAFSVSSTGVLQQISGSPFNYPLWQMQGDPSGSYLIGISGKTAYWYGSDDDSLYVFNINQSTGAISPVAGSPFATTYAPFNMAVRPSATGGEFVYTFSINDLGTAYNPIEGYQISTTSGTLSALSLSTSTPTAWGQFDPAGSYLFSYSNSGSAISLAALTVGSTGGLTATGTPVTLNTGGYWAVSDVP